MTKKYQFSLFFLMALFVVFAAFALAGSPAAASDSDLPPRATPPSSNPPTNPPVEQPTEPTAEPPALTPELPAVVNGGFIQLQVHFSAAWPWDQANWQGLWTTVQWSDGVNWHDVDGWRGNLDSIAKTDGWVGQKLWWVAGDDLGKGPFRWLVFLSPDGRLLTTSEPFYLPDGAGKTTTVSAAVGP